jgi:uncharacterized protein YdeI (BOF family)
MVGTLDVREKLICIITLLVILIIAMTGIGGAMQTVPAGDGLSGTTQGLYGSQKVVFLEHNMVANGTVVQGEVPFRSVNFPSYWFNANTGELNGEIDFPINDSLTLIFGDSLTLTGSFGSGTGNKLYGAYSLPAYADKAIIYMVDRSGDITMRANDRLFTLKPGNTYTYSENETLSDANGVVNVVYNHTYTNHGLIDKNSIRTSMIAG